jgi:hypothetical protein
MIAVIARDRDRACFHRKGRDENREIGPSETKSNTKPYEGHKGHEASAEISSLKNLQA